MNVGNHCHCEETSVEEAIPIAATNDEILKAYSEQIEKIMQDYSFQSVDIISMNSSNKLRQEDLNKMRNKFLDEHIHSDDEVRYFIDGRGLFCIHAASQVFQILCTAGDFIAVPANTKHWFDMGPEPNFKCIRFFSNEDGWVAQYTGDDIAKKFPNMETLETVTA